MGGSPWGDTKRLNYQLTLEGVGPVELETAAITAIATNALPLAAALRKYGPDAFEWEIVEPCPRGELDDRGAFYIFAFDCLSPKGYNLASGGGQAQCYTAEARAKLSQSLRSSDNFKEAMRRLRWASSRPLRPEFSGPPHRGYTQLGGRPPGAR